MYPMNPSFLLFVIALMVLPITVLSVLSDSGNHLASKNWSGQGGIFRRCNRTHLCPPYAYCAYSFKGPNVELLEQDKDGNLGTQDEQGSQMGLCVCFQSDVVLHRSRRAGCVRFSLEGQRCDNDDECRLNLDGHSQLSYNLSCSVYGWYNSECRCTRASPMVQRVPCRHRDSLQQLYKWRELNFKNEKEIKDFMRMSEYLKELRRTHGDLGDLRGHLDLLCKNDEFWDYIAKRCVKQNDFGIIEHISFRTSDIFIIMGIVMLAMICFMYSIRPGKLTARAGTTTLRLNGTGGAHTCHDNARFGCRPFRADCPDDLVFGRNFLDSPLSPTGGLDGQLDAESNLPPILPPSPTNAPPAYDDICGGGSQLEVANNQQDACKESTSPEEGGLPDYKDAVIDLSATEAV